MRIVTAGSIANVLGEVAEWLKAPVSKTGISGNRDRGFESRPLRHAIGARWLVHSRHGSVLDFLVAWGVALALYAKGCSALVVRCLASDLRRCLVDVHAFSGEVPERLNGHAWKACVGRPTAGSNPVLSAMVGWLRRVAARCQSGSGGWGALMARCATWRSVWSPPRRLCASLRAAVGPWAELRLRFGELNGGHVFDRRSMRFRRGSGGISLQWRLPAKVSQGVSQAVSDAASSWANRPAIV